MDVIDANAHGDLTRFLFRIDCVANRFGKTLFGKTGFLSMRPGHFERRLVDDRFDGVDAVGFNGVRCDDIIADDLLDDVDKIRFDFRTLAVNKEVVDAVETARVDRVQIRRRFVAQGVIRKRNADVI